MKISGFDTSSLMVSYIKKYHTMTMKSTEKLIGEKPVDNPASIFRMSKFESQIRGDQVAQKNIQDALSMIHIAYQSLDSVVQIGQRLREISLQYQNGINSDDEKKLLRQEAMNLIKEMDHILKNTEYNNISLFGKENFVIQTGANALDKYNLTMPLALAINVYRNSSLNNQSGNNKLNTDLTGHDLNSSENEFFNTVNTLDKSVNSNDSVDPTGHIQSVKSNGNQDDRMVVVNQAVQSQSGNITHQSLLGGLLGGVLGLVGGLLDGVLDLLLGTKPGGSTNNGSSNPVHPNNPSDGSSDQAPSIPVGDNPINHPDQTDYNPLNPLNPDGSDETGGPSGPGDSTNLNDPSSPDNFSGPEETHDEIWNRLLSPDFIDKHILNPLIEARSQMAIHESILERRLDLAISKEAAFNNAVFNVTRGDFMQELINKFKHEALLHSSISLLHQDLANRRAQILQLLSF